MKKIILSIITGCFFVSYAEYVAIIEIPTTNEAIKPPIEPDIPKPDPTPGGCDGTGIMKIKNIISDGQTWENSIVGISKGGYFFTTSYPDGMKIENDCWGNSTTKKVSRLLVDADIRPYKRLFESDGGEQWNDANILYLRFVEAGDELPVLKAYYEASGTYYFGSKAGKPEEDVVLIEWRKYLVENKLLEYSIQVSEVPYN